MTEAFAEFAERARARVDEALEQHLLPVISAQPVLGEAMRYSLFAGGKRLRPLLALAAADAVARQNGTSQDDAMALALPLACAVEFIHTYSLIHDDLPAMDDDSLRRGRPTLHVVYGDGMAVLAGDALQTEAFWLLTRVPAESDPEIASRRLKVLSILASSAGAHGMVGGQAIDLQAAGQVRDRSLRLDVDQLQDMHRLKTGAMIRASAVGGALMAGASAAAERAIQLWSWDIGLAFQIVDDILDVEGSSSQLGKTAGKDAARDKPTYPALWGLEQSRVMAAQYREHADAVLRKGGLTEGWLGAMADWVISRKN